MSLYEQDRQPQMRPAPAARSRWPMVLLVAAGVIGALSVGIIIGFEAAYRGLPAQPAAGVAERAPLPTDAAPQIEATPVPSGSSPAAGNAEAEAAATATPGSTVESPAARAEVAAYFAQTDALLASAKQAGDPNVVARKILEQAVAGDTTGLDQLMATQRTVAERLASVQAPVACAEHHRRSLALVQKGASMLAQVRDAIQSGDTSGLAAVSVEGSEIEREARALDALAVSIRQQHGLP